MCCQAHSATPCHIKHFKARIYDFHCEIDAIASSRRFRTFLGPSRQVATTLQVPPCGSALIAKAVQHSVAGIRCVDVHSNAAPQQLGRNAFTWCTRHDMASNALPGQNDDRSCSRYDAISVQPQKCCTIMLDRSGWRWLNLHGSIALRGCIAHAIPIPRTVINQAVGMLPVSEQDPPAVALLWQHDFGSS